MADNEPKIIGKAASCAMSGHVSYSAQQLAFYGMIDRRINKQAALRKSGMLAVKPTRNPMRAEKTPRKDHMRNFDYSIPEGPKEVGKKTYDRWNYPEIDYGLMGKFASQKQKYADSENMLVEYQKELDKIEKEKHEQLSANLPTGRSARSVPSSARTDRSEAPELTGRSTHRGEGKLSDQSIVNFRILANDNPEVLEKWRAERAAGYLSKLNAPLDPPPKRTVRHPKAMLPSGYFHEQMHDYGDRNYVAPKPPPKQRGALKSNAKDPSEEINKMKASLKDLLSTLDKTEEALSRQELAVNLNARKRASYEAPRGSARSSARSTYS